MNITRGDIYYVDAIDSVGSEQRGGRPAIVVSNDKCNQHSPVVEAPRGCPRRSASRYIASRPSGSAAIAGAAPSRSFRRSIWPC